MFINTNILMELQKAKETDLVRQAESSRFQTLASPDRLTLGKAFMRTIANTLVLLGLR